MPDKFAESTRRLEQLVHQILKETDPVLYDELAEEIWRVLAERERLANEQVRGNKSDPPKAA
jgi:hypothetical protein